MKVKFLSLTIAAVVVVAGLGFTSPVKASGVPVIDIANITNSKLQHVEDIAKYVEQIAQLKSQLDQMKQQYASLTGSRNLGEILNNPALQDYLPTDWQEVYSKVQNGGYSGLTGSAAAIRDANAMFDACKSKEGADKQLCERSAVKSAQDKAFALDAFDKAKDRWDQIAGLMRQINATTDPKSIAELQARITAEAAAVQNEQTKMQLYAMVAQAEDRLIERQVYERESQTWSNTGRGVDTKPLTFGQ